MTPSRASIETVNAVSWRVPLLRLIRSSPSCIDALLGQRQADQPAAVLRHEVDRVGRRHLRGDDQIAFILAVLVIDQDEHAAVARLVDDLLGRGEEAVLAGGASSGFATKRLHALEIAREHVDLEIDRLARVASSPNVVTAAVCGMMLSANSTPVVGVATSLTVSETPSTVIEPLGARRARARGRRAIVDARANRLPRRTLGHLADAVDMAGDDMPAELVAELQRALEVEPAARGPHVRGGARDGLARDVDREPARRPCRPPSGTRPSRRSTRRGRSCAVS